MSTELNVDYSAIDISGDAFLKVKDDWKELRAETAERLSADMKRTLDLSIDSSGLNDKNGRIKSWQQSRVGTYHGFAAVSPVSGGERGNNPGAITNYLENSHKVRTSQNESYRSRRKVNKTRAFKFYADADKQLEKRLAAEDKKLTAALEKSIKELFENG